MPTFDDRNAQDDIRPYWWVEIEGIRNRFSTYTPAWSESLLDGLLAHYGFSADETDDTGNGHDGTASGASLDGSGKIGNCYLFNGSSDYITIPDFQELSSWAVSAWVRHDAAAWETFREDVVTGYTTRHYCIVYGSYPQIGSVLTHSTSLSVSTWYHIIWQSDENDGCSIIVNGDWAGRARSATPAIWDSAPIQRIGWSSSSGGAFDGRIDQVAIYNRTLIEGEVTALYGAGNGIDYPFLTVQNMKPYLSIPPTIGGQEADPINGTCSVPGHSFELLDGERADDGLVTEMVAVSDTPFATSYLTAPLTASDTSLPLEDYSDFDSAGTVYLDRETINYTGKSTDSSTGLTADHGLTGEVASNGGTASIMYDADRSEADHYWKGAILEVTAGTNNGQVRTIADSYYDSGSSMGWLMFKTPMPAACDSTTTYKITWPPDQLSCSSLTEADDYWIGAIVKVTAGTNSGEYRWVSDFDAADDRLTLVSPMPEPCDSTTTFSIYLYKLTGCTRGAFSSEAAAHSVVDAWGSQEFRPVSTKIPFLKTRKVWIYENRQGCAESEAIKTVGFLDDYRLTRDGSSYQFQCSGLLKLLSKNLMSIQQRGEVIHRPVWGGRYKKEAVEMREAEAGGTVVVYTNYWFYFYMSNGSQKCTIDRIFYRCISGDFPSTGGNLKIDKEILHYIGTSKVLDMPGEFFPILKLSENDTPVEAAGFSWSQPDIAAVACLENRGLFHELIGADNVARWKDDQEQPEITEESSQSKEPRSLNAFMQEHEIGAEILQVCVCDDSTVSDFPRYDLLEYSSLSGGDFAAGDTVTGGTSSVTATVMEVTERTSTTGTLLVAFSSPINTPYTETETISCGGVSATLDTYTMEIRKRNNAIDVVLQLLTSTGTTAGNGPYDTLIAGFGLGIDQSLIDIDGIELLRDQWFALIPVSFVLTEPESAKDWLEENVFKPLQIFPLETYEGKISLGCMMTEAEAKLQNAASALTAFDEDHIRAEFLPDWTSGSPPISKVTIKYNKHPCESDWLGELQVLFGHASDWYGDLGRVVELDFGTFYLPDSTWDRVSHLDSRLPPMLRRFVSVVWDRFAQYPCPVIKVEVPYSDIKNDIGDPILLTHDALPNMRTSQRGLSSEYYQITARTPDPFRGCMVYTLWQIGVHDKKYGKRTPSCKVSAYAADTPSAGKSTITVYNNCFSREGSQDIVTGGWTAGWEIMFLASDWDLIASPVETATIESVDTGNNQIVLDQNMATNIPSDGSWLEFAPYDSCTQAQKDAACFMADKDRTLGSGGASAYKYK